MRSGAAGVRKLDKNRHSNCEDPKRDDDDDCVSVSYIIRIPFTLYISHNRCCCRHIEIPTNISH